MTYLSIEQTISQTIWSAAHFGSCLISLAYGAFCLLKRFGPAALFCIKNIFLQSFWDASLFFFIVNSLVLKMIGTSILSDHNDTNSNQESVK